jgi:hypothetical protein
VVHFVLDADHWDYKEETGNDYGRDCIVELSENDEWNNHKIEGQIKGTSSPAIVGDEISFPMPVRTIEYALGTPNAFILFVADTNSNVAYYQCVQQYFIDHKELKDKLDQKTINIRIPRSQVLPENDNQLQHWARTIFVNGPGDSLQAYNQEMTG